MLDKSPAEDAQLTKLVRKNHKFVVLTRPVMQPLGIRSLKEVWQRQVRWARLRRSTFPHYWALEVFGTILWPILFLMYFHYLATAACVFLGWYLVEWIFALYMKWNFNPIAAMVRDAIIPLLWLEALGNKFVWKDKSYSCKR
jgi:ceramide glucosyltransferase